MSAKLITVAIPLHEGARWYDAVCGNLERCKGAARFIISDATCRDELLPRLRSQFDGRNDIAWLGRREIARGWAPHCNDLLDRAETPLFMWLPQDDEIDRDWLEKARIALDRRPAAVMACGKALAREGPGLQLTSGLHARPEYESSLLSERLEAAGKHLLSDPGSLGLFFRGVFRRERLPRLPDVGEGQEWSDLYWVLSLLALGPVEPIDAVYLKAWHSANTHGKWRPFIKDPAFIGHVVESFSLALHQPGIAHATGLFWRALFESRSNKLPLVEYRAWLEGYRVEGMPPILRSAFLAARDESLRGAISRKNSRRRNRRMAQIALAIALAVAAVGLFTMRGV
jgi:hypothetical protein